MSKKTEINNITRPVYELLRKESVARFDVGNITELSDAQLDALRCGDIVAKKTGNQKHAYIVSYKEDGQGICLTYCDGSGYIETVSYDKTESGWQYNSTDVFDASTISGGTKLYKHTFTIEDEDMNVREITIINNSSTAIISLRNVGELLKGTVTDSTDPDPDPKYFILIEYEEETEIGAAYRLKPAAVLIPASGTTYSTDTVKPL